MINLKTAEEIEVMKEGGRRLKEVVKKLLPTIKQGITTKEIDQKTEKLIKEYQGEASFKKVRGYHWSTCLSVNEEIVHTPPSERVLSNGDILTLDIGVYFRGYHTDYATTIIVGEVKDKKIKKFLESGKRTLYKVIKQARVGNYIGNISYAIEQEILKNGFFVIKELTGHGIGKKLHEEPLIPCFLDGSIKKTAKIVKGMVLAIEVIYSTGSTTISYKRENQWSLVTADRSLAACFEHTIAIFENKPLILT